MLHLAVMMVTFGQMGINMKTILILLFATLLFSQSIQQRHLSIIKKRVAAGSSYEIDDDYSTDTQADYTNITQTMSVSSGAAHGTDWQVTVSYHETALSSVDHYVQADCNGSSGTDGSTLIARCDNTNYYYVYWDNGVLKLKCSDNRWLGSYGSGLSGDYTIKMIVSGSGASVDIDVYVDDTLRIDVSDTHEDRLTTGSYVGVRFQRGTAIGISSYR